LFKGFKGPNMYTAGLGPLNDVFATGHRNRFLLASV
jgi:hypothetical protein